MLTSGIWTLTQKCIRYLHIAKNVRLFHYISYSLKLSYGYALNKI